MLTSNLAGLLPDCYAQGADSNNAKLLELARLALADMEADLADVERMVSLEESFGGTLDAYGAMMDQPRGGLDDAQYRVMIRNRVAGLEKIMDETANNGFISIGIMGAAARKITQAV